MSLYGVGEIAAGMNPLCRNLVEALGIDLQGVRKVALIIRYDDIVTVEIERLVTEGQLEHVRHILCLARAYAEPLES